MKSSGGKMNYNDVWEELANIPVNTDDEIEQSFLHFEIGTNKFTIWHWIEEKYNISIAKDLLPLTN